MTETKGLLQRQVISKIDKLFFINMHIPEAMIIQHKAWGEEKTKFVSSRPDGHKHRKESSLSHNTTYIQVR